MLLNHGEAASTAPEAESCARNFRRLKVFMVIRTLVRLTNSLPSAFFYPAQNRRTLEQIIQLRERVQFVQQNSLNESSDTGEYPAQADNFSKMPKRGYPSRSKSQ
jgi:hypothetical protein